MKRKWALILAFSLFLSAPVFAADQWDKTDPAGIASAADIDTLLQANNSAQDRLVSLYRRGAAVIPSSSAAIQVLAGEIAIPNADGSVVRYGVNTTTTNVGWVDIDTGSEENSKQYYVYACLDADATTFTVKISASSSSPSGVTYYRKIGAFYNNSSGNITNVTNYRNDEGAKYRDVIKGWVSFNATGTIAVSSSYNVSSITDDGTGQYTINWTNSFADTNYVVAGSVGGTGTGGNFPGRVSLRATASPLTTSAAKIESRDHGGALDDFTYTTVMAIGDN